MKIYLDTCSIQRPLDDKSQIRVILEADAVLAILDASTDGRVEIISSEALLFEIERNPNLARQEYALDVLSSASAFVVVSDTVEKRARDLHARGLTPLDALHVASSEAAQADFLCTCDDRFLRKARSMKELRTRVVSPLDLIGDLPQ